MRTIILALLSSVSLPAALHAQETAPGIVLEPIIISSQKRTSNTHDVPASVSVTGGEDAYLNNTRTRANLVEETANAQMGSVTAKLYTSFTAIRGVGSALIESDPAVGMYLDGVGIGSSQGHNGTLLDINRVEVLRGPQGTLYGRNNIAGSINFISNLPDPDRIGGEIGFDAGTDGALGLTGILNTPLGNNGWAARGAFTTSKTDGFLHSTVDGDDLGGAKDIHGRFSIGGNVSDNLEFLGIVDVEHQKLDREMFGMPEKSFLEGRNGIAIDDAAVINSDVATTSAKFTYTLENGDKIISQTGFQSTRTDVFGNGFPRGTFAQFDAVFQSMGLKNFRYRSGNPFEGDYRQWSQEIRYVSEDNERFNWVAGLYGEYSNALRIYGADSKFDGGSLTLQTRGKTKTASGSAFADGTYELSDQWKIFGGLRVGYDRKDFDYDFNANALAAAFGLSSPFAPGYASSLSDTSATYRIGMQFAATDNLNFYGSVSTGYKSGGFNSSFVSVGDQGAYDAEKLTSYEIGLKSLSLDDRLSIEASVFYIDWRDQQVQGFNPLTGGTPIVNSPRSESYGAEISAQLQLTDQWSVRVAAGYADATYKDFTDAIGPGGRGSKDASGNHQQFVSPFTGSVGIGYEWELGWNDFVGKAGAEYQYRSSYYFDVQNTLRQPGYGLLNAHIGLENNRFAGLVYARNLTDERYRTVASDLGTGALVNVGDPLSVGATFKVKF
ncbi:TonB-dependent receptor [Phyllobacterium sp. SB3]|uniref:TonB-dependent receptor n=1 Tax=Phyllobacterium sp. SB3 TaxID=3156073 RepID=UPI0032AFE4A9